VYSARRSGRFYLLTANKHNPTVVQLCRLAIENASGFEQVNCFRLSARCSVLKKKWGLHEQAKNNKERATHEDPFLMSDMLLSCRGAGIRPSRIPRGFNPTSRQTEVYRTLLFRNHHGLNRRWQWMVSALRKTGICSHTLDFAERVRISRGCTDQHHHGEARGLRWRYPIIVRDKLQRHGATTISQRRVYFLQERFTGWRIKVV